MKPRIKLAETLTPEGGRLVLFEQDGAYVISCDGQELMHSRAAASEILLGELGASRVEREGEARILIGGLGLGFTLRAVLAATGPHTKVEVVELIPDIVAWNRTMLRALNGACLDDPRVTVVEADAARVVHESAPRCYDAMLLDVDNGPVAMVAPGNAALYSTKGLKRVKAALKPKGHAIFWSAGPDEAFERRLQRLGFQVEVVPAKVHERAKREAYRLFVAQAGQ